MPWAYAGGYVPDPDPRPAGSAGDLTDSAARACLSEGRARRELRTRRWDDLLAEWSASSEALARAGSTPAMLSLVGLRAALVDELERRDRRAFSAWFAGEQKRLGLGR
jgi:hypothetical protein